MAAQDKIQVVMDPETRDIIDRIPSQARSRFVRSCIQRAQGFARRELGLPGAPAGKVEEGTLSKFIGTRFLRDKVPS